MTNYFVPITTVYVGLVCFSIRSVTVVFRFINIIFLVIASKSAYITNGTGICFLWLMNSTPFSSSLGIFIACFPFITMQSFLCASNTSLLEKHCNQFMQKFFLLLCLVCLNINELKSLIST